ncbi:putative porin [Lentisalinibacter salinarum]|uniref:putative porin n=1 Tax=Lentisalinibacter salinarum TaxID=2992239 RepID=UPI003864D37D
MRRALAGSVIALALTVSISAFAQSQDKNAELESQVRELNEKVAALEAKQAKFSWAEKLSLKGDFRYRFEGIDVEGLENRDRQRLRSRLMINADVNDDIRVGIEISTGGSNPRSRDVTLDGDASAKDISLRRAYVTWQATDRMTVTAGKMSQPWARNPVEYFYDSDYMPEGLAVAFTGGAGFYGKGYWLQIDERLGSDDSSVWGGELGYNGSTFYASLGYQDFQDMQGYNPCYLSICNGNTLDADRNLVYDYNITRLRGGVKLAGFDIFGSWARNGDADEDTAYAFGAVYGKVSYPGSWSIAAAYQDMKKDALYGGMIDATFAGGRSAHDGFSVKGTYAITKNWTGSFIWFDNSIDKLADERDYNRYQLDLLFKF